MQKISKLEKKESEKKRFTLKESDYNDFGADWKIDAKNKNIRE